MYNSLVGVQLPLEYHLLLPGYFCGLPLDYFTGPNVRNEYLKKKKKSRLFLNDQRLFVV